MHFGAAATITDETLDTTTVAKMYEAAGFESIYFGEHSHIPAAGKSKYPGGELPRDYYRTLDLFVCLTEAALATMRIRFGTGICQLVQRDPIHFAKQAASIDHISNGRLSFSVGAGWNVEEREHHGVKEEDRYEVLRERIEAIREIWRNDEAEYHGNFVNFDPMFQWPKPVQDPLPIYVAGNGEGSDERALAYGDGWTLLAIPGEEERIKSFVSRAEESGRELPVTVVGLPSDPKAIESYAELGVSRCVFWIRDARPGPLEAEIEDARRAVEQFDSAALSSR